ncbi:DUF2949 domain-containing protein [Crocosphaera sp. UHCC 0190]|uniref:DUF2949 domain-containing protein n=1 Tax=Crocosphaera sp. UHCC 0190 TaxID=3110246 RepID=UPI002B1FE9E0|nr:DUF2949 domain-containing protein [Crocosphaera sp. UHCC 0190]MEA5510675.1 DUF2949 domain-containing protein [Crocosphaera sp. UHCC 0190]
MNPTATQFIDFLQQDLAIPAESIDLALRDEQAMPHHFPMILWQYGLVNKEQLESVFDWLDDHLL